MSKYIKIGRFMVNKNSISHISFNPRMFSSSSYHMNIHLCNEDIHINITDKIPFPL